MDAAIVMKPKGGALATGFFFLFKKGEATWKTHSESLFVMEN